jgi:hypothetical protein
MHRVDRVPSFFSSRPNLDFLTPSHAGKCVTHPLPIWFRGERGGGAAHSLTGEGVGESQFGRGDNRVHEIG